MRLNRVKFNIHLEINIQILFGGHSPGNPIPSDHRVESLYPINWPVFVHNCIRGESRNIQVWIMGRGLCFPVPLLLPFVVPQQTAFVTRPGKQDGQDDRRNQSWIYGYCRSLCLCKSKDNRVARNNQVQTSLGWQGAEERESAFWFREPNKTQRQQLMVVLLNLNPCYKKEVSLIFLK